MAAIFQPLGALLRLAFRTVAIAAGVVRYAYFTTAIAGIDVAAKLGGTTGCEVAQDALPGLRHPQARHATIGSGQRTDDVGHFERWLVHGQLSSPRLRNNASGSANKAKEHCHRRLARWIADTGDSFEMPDIDLEDAAGCWPTT